MMQAHRTDRARRYDALVSLLWDDARWDDADWWRSLRGDAPAFFELAWAEGVFPDAYERFRAFAGPLPELEEKRALYQRHRAQLLAAVPGVAGRVALLKGFAIEALYPPGRQRFSTDADLAVASVDHFWDVAAVLLRSSYELPTMLWFRDPGSGEVWGSARFFHTDPLPGEFGEIEVQIGMFPISYCTHLPYAEFGRRLRRVTVAGMALHVPCAEDHLLVMLGEFESRARAKVRDVYDWLRVLRSGPSADVAAVVERAARYGVANGLAVLRNGLRDYGPPGGAPDAAAFLAHPAVRAARTSRFHAAHRWSHFRKVGGTPLPVRRFLLQELRGLTLRWNAKNRFLPLLRAMDANGAAKRFFDAGFYTLMIRISDEANAFAWSRSGGHHVVSTPAGHFVASTNAVLTDADLDGLSAALTDSRSRSSSAPSA